MGTEQTSQKPKFFAVAVLISLTLIIAMALIALNPGGRKLSLNNSSTIHVTLAPFLTSLVRETSAKIVYEPSNGPVETVVFLQDSDSQPAMIIPGPDAKAFFCLYYADVVYRLVKVNPGEKTTPFATNSYLNYIVISSSCAVESGTTNDWHSVSRYIDAIPDDVFKQEAFGFQRKVLSAGVAEHIWNMEHGLIE